MSQSSNDTFPAAMSVATALAVNDRLLPALGHLLSALETKRDAWKKQNYGLVAVGLMQIPFVWYLSYVG